jgi:hypothetical protein
VSRTPVHIVTGAPGAARALIERLLAARAGWATLAPAGCPCCSGRVETQIALARLLRERKPGRVLLELKDEQHLAGIRRALAEWPLARYVEPGRVITLPQDSEIAPEALGA